MRCRQHGRECACVPWCVSAQGCGRHQYGALLRPWRYELTARQRCACFEALHQRQNELTKQHTKETAVDDLQVEKKSRELSSLHIKHDVN
eukprot:6188055-Pleurochrysis_carterae.AAC.4